MSFDQRDPRRHNPDHLRYVASQPCCLCGDNTSVQACHLRFGSINDDKRETGMQEKPHDDRWVLPLCSAHHREQHGMNEREFWKKYRVDPFAMALHYRKR